MTVAGCFFARAASCVRRALVLSWCLKPFEKRLAVDFPPRVECKAQILGERAFAGAVKAGNPHADLARAAAEAFVEQAQHPLEVRFDVISGDVFSDLPLELLALVTGERNDLLDAAIELAGGFKQTADHKSASNVN